ncbi:MAG TPA: extracellular solute-binding protein, partial [Chloroflexota bacterium]|nr:extracellular solute-binding protein [Chloroflexota bacterium]
QWTMPFGQAISGILAYNEEHLRAEGLAMPSELWSAGRWTWATLQEYAVKLTRRDGSRHGFWINKAFETGYCPFVYANGGLVIDKDGKKPAINSAEAREAFDLLVDMYTRQLVSPNKQEIAQENAVNRFLNGRLAILPQGSWEIKDLNLKATAIKWNLVPTPIAPRTRRNGSTNQMASIAMSKSGKNKDAVWLWQKYIGSKEGQDVIARGEYFPARVDSAESIYYDTKLGPTNRPLMRDILKVTQAMPYVNVGGKTVEWNPVASPLIDQMIEGQLSVKDALQQIHDQLTALFSS